ncbi:hypothetical protein [Gynuella sunshinyii]|nr:hypothetical protein [Gynuella sunshinyii]
MHKMLLSKVFVISAALLISISASALSCNAANYCGDAVPKIYHIDSKGMVFLGIEGKVPSTCSWYTRQFTFDSTTDAGKSMLSSLLSMIAQKQKIMIWYSPVDSSLSDSDQTSGCTPETMAKMTGLGVAGL